MVTPAELTASIAAAAGSVLETMFFAEAEPGPSVSEEQRHQMIAVRIGFDGGLRGEFRIGFEPHLARALAAAFLGIDESEVADEEVNQVICETANMICGAALSRIESDEHMRLEMPALTDNTAECAEFLQACFVTPEGAICTGVRIE
jgi:CheY-specific phosphatase CheX